MLICIVLFIARKRLRSRATLSKVWLHTSALRRWETSDALTLCYPAPINNIIKFTLNAIVDAFELHNVGLVHNGCSILCVYHWPFRNQQQKLTLVS